MRSRFRLTVFLLAALSFGFSSTGQAVADSLPAPRGIPTVPPELENNPYVRSLINSLGGLLQSTSGNHAQGKVVFFKRFSLQLETAPHVYREVHLHQGTVINPRGATPQAGEAAEIDGVAQSDGSLNADVVTLR